jgi:peptidoglycan/xylan/chitin deacetylase (PgdA/CDA1 family)
VTEKHRTWVAAGTVATAVVAGAVAADRRLGTVPLVTVAGVVASSSYLTGTFAARNRLFGAPVRLERIAGTFALTFDDGPDPRFTPAICELLAERGHRATFFVLGRAVRRAPHLVRTILDAGHEVACHGDDHRLLAFASRREIGRQIRATEDAVVRAGGHPPVALFRAPHGVRSPWLARAVEHHGYRLCAWDGAVFDTARPGPDVIAARVARLLRPGATVLLHDGDGSDRAGSRQQTLDALPAILDTAEREGLRSACMSTLVA